VNPKTFCVGQIRSEAGKDRSTKVGKGQEDDT